MSKEYIAKESTSQEILSWVKGSKPKRYGFRRNDNDSNPSTRIEYLFDAVGMTPAYMNFGNTFNYGSWGDIWFIRDNFPCMVKSSGSVDYQLSKTDHTKKTDNSTASDVANTSYDGNAMSAIPLVWVKRYTEGSYTYFIACEEQYDESYHAYAHTRPDGSISPYMFFPMYKGSYISSKCRSLSGQAPGNSQSASTEKTYCEANGANWTMRPYIADELLADLLTLIGKSDNSQAVFGQGHTTGGSSASDLLTTGSLNASGQFFGYSDTTHQVKVFYIEGFWGDRWDREIGMIVNNGTVKVAKTPETTYNLTGDGYDVMSVYPSYSGSGTGWQRTVKADELGTFPTVIGGGDSTYICDYTWYNRNIVSVPLRGGACAYGSGCGSRYLAVDVDAGNAYWTIGASPFLKNPS